MAPAMNKVINMFRARSSSSATADDKKRMLAKVGNVASDKKSLGCVSIVTSKLPARQEEMYLF